MRVLTDTHSLVWALSDSSMLSKKAQKAMAESEVIASVVNLWELILKINKQGAPLKDPLTWWNKYITGPGIPTLSIRTSHVITLDSLARRFPQRPVRSNLGGTGKD